MRRAKKARNFVANGLSFKSNWLRRWRKFSRPIYYNAKYSSHNWKYSNRPLPTWFLHFFWIELLRWLPQVVYSIYCVKKYDKAQQSGPPETDRKAERQGPDIVPVIWGDIQHLSFLQNTLLINCWREFRKFDEIRHLNIHLKIQNWIEILFLCKRISNL